MPWGDMVEMQRLASEAAVESRQRRMEAKRKAEEEEAQKKVAEAKAKRQKMEEARKKAEEEEKVEVAAAIARRVRETDMAIQLEFEPLYETELSLRENRRKEEEEQRKKEEEDQRAERAAKGKGSKGGKGSTRSPSSMANLQKRDAAKVKDLLQKSQKNEAEIHVLRAMLRHHVMQEQDRRLVRIFSNPTEPSLFPCVFTRICSLTSRSYECFQFLQCGVLNTMFLSHTRTCGKIWRRWAWKTSSC